MLVTMTGAVAAAFAGRTVAGQVTGGTRTASPQPMPSPNAPANENVPAGLDGADIPVRNGDRPMAPVTWLEIRSDAQKLLQLAVDFKNQVDRTNLAATLPLPLIKEAHRIEKLAKQIQQQMKR
jgi:hypothetical protein